jgi:hypothetical protein
MNAAQQQHILSMSLVGAKPRCSYKSGVYGVDHIGGFHLAARDRREHVLE